MSTYRSTALGAAQLRSFLRSVDRHLAARARIVLIGGSAAALAHGATTTTTDVDTFNDTTTELVDAVERANAETGLDVPISRASVADVPYNYEDRLERHLEDLPNLEVWVLEKHDLVLSKTVRGYDHDLQQILEIHQAVGLDLDTLVERWTSEMTHAMGDPGRLRSNLLLMIETVFGEAARGRVERALQRT